jgi:hypothetical protein
LRRHCRWPALEVDVHPSFVLFCRILQTQFLAYLFNSRLDFLDVVYGVISFADNTRNLLISSISIFPWYFWAALTHANGSVHSAAHI